MNNKNNNLKETVLISVLTYSNAYLDKSIIKIMKINLVNIA